MEHRVHDDRKPARDHPRVSRNIRESIVDVRSMNRRSKPSPMFIGTDPKKGKERERGREGDVFVSTEFAVNFDDDILFALL